MKLPVCNSSPGRTRTSDLVVNSHPLYQLSYRGSFFYRTEVRYKKAYIVSILVRCFEGKNNRNLSAALRAHAAVEPGNMC